MIFLRTCTIIFTIIYIKIYRNNSKSFTPVSKITYISLAISLDSWSYHGIDVIWWNRDGPLDH